MPLGTEQKHKSLPNDFYSYINKKVSDTYEEYLLSQHYSNNVKKYYDLKGHEYKIKFLEVSKKLLKHYKIKNEEIQNKLSHFLSEKGIYPTHISEYLSCSLKYYFNKIAEISKFLKIVVY